MGRDWTGNSNSVYKALGASNHADDGRESNDFYATDPIAIDKLSAKFDIPHKVWECACGSGCLSARLQELGHVVYSTDIIDRGYVGMNRLFNFLKTTKMPEDYSILTNPPYNKAMEFVLHGLSLVSDNNYVIMFLKLTFLEGIKRRKELFDRYPPKLLFVCSERVLCAKNAEFEIRKREGSAVAYGWFVWQKGFTGKTTID